MDSNFLGKFKADITKRHSFLVDRLSPDKISPDKILSDDLKTNNLAAEFYEIAYGPIQHKRPGQETRYHQGTLHHKTIGVPSRTLSQGSDSLSQGKSIWQRWGLSLVNFLTGKQTLAVREQRLKNGAHQWCVYDSHSDTHHVFESEAGVRSWLEQRYYR